MVPRPDPYRVLGLVPGASPNEIRSAYRRLAKLHHPDTAGERSLARFLAIQAAYEELVDAEGRLRSRGWPRGGGAASYRTTGTSAKSASRDAWRAHRTSSSAGSAGGGSANRSSSGAADGAGPTSASGAKAGPGAKAGFGTKPGAGRASDGASGPKTSRTAGPGRGGGPRGTGTRTRAERRTARPGSTTYDEAKQPLDPSWAGGEWYGASSGRYWTLNPREYADPRKHGPEYQERARKAADREATGRPEAGPLPPPAPPSFASSAWAAPPPPPPAQKGSSRAPDDWLRGARPTGAPDAGSRQAGRGPASEPPASEPPASEPPASEPADPAREPGDPAGAADPASPVDRLRRLVRRSNGHGAP
jgi:hypothetical protein